MESRDFEKTTELIDRILDLDEDNLLAIISRAMIYSEQGKKQEAAKAANPGGGLVLTQCARRGS